MLISINGNAQIFEPPPNGIIWEEENVCLEHVIKNPVTFEPMDVYVETEIMHTQTSTRVQNGCTETYTTKWIKQSFWHNSEKVPNRSVLSNG